RCDWTVEFDDCGAAGVADQQGARRSAGALSHPRWVGFYVRVDRAFDLDAGVDWVECVGEFLTGVAGVTRDCSRGARVRIGPIGRIGPISAGAVQDEISNAM